MSNKAKSGSAGKRREKFVYPDDRTKTVKIIDTICRIVAVILSILFILNVHTLMRGGGYEDRKIVPLFGMANSRVEESYMKPEIPDQSVIICKTTASVDEGDVVQYYDGEGNPVSRVVKVSEETVTLKGDSQDREVTVPREDVHGEVVFHTTSGYGFMGWYRTALGAVTTVVLTIFLLSFGDILMIKKRKAALEERRAAQAKKENMKLKKQAKKDAYISELGNIEDKSATAKAKKQEKIEKDKEVIAKDMKELQEKMKAEEEEFNRKKGK